MKNSANLTPSKVPVARARNARRPTPNAAPKSSDPAISDARVAAVSARAAIPAQTRAPAARPVHAAAEGLTGYIAIRDGAEVGEVEPLKTEFFDSIHQVKALTVANKKLCVAAKNQSFAQARGYQRDDLYAIAEIAYHYLMNGAAKIALTLYEGLEAVAPGEAHFQLGLGLTHDHMGDKRQAIACYSRASELDPHDARADVNRAELYLENGDRRSARQLLERAVNKAKNRGDSTLERKASALLSHLSRAA